MDLGLIWQKSHIAVTPRVFYQSVKDYVVGVPSTNMAANMVSNMMSSKHPYQWQNQDATLYGVDAKLSAIAFESLKLDMVAAITRGKRDGSNDPLYRLAPASLYTTISWDSERYSLGLTSELAAAQSKVSEIQNESASPGYGVLHGKGTYKFNCHVSASLYVNNIFDKAYQPHLSGINRVNNTTQPVGERLFGAGREIGITLNIAI